ncbi:MAG: DUF456 domain-containing protein [Bacillota bacterium]
MIGLYWLLIVILFLTGLAGVFIPMIPDIIPVWIAVLIYHFGSVGIVLPNTFWVGLVIITIITVFSDFFANAFAVKKTGGSNLSVLAALVGLALGLVVLGPLGVIIGPFALIFLVEYIKSNSRDYKKSLKIAFSTVFAYIGSAVVKLLLILFIIFWFFIVVL